MVTNELAHHDWFGLKLDRARLRSQLPRQLAARRVALATQRDDELRRQIRDLRHRVLNAPWFAAQRDVHNLEERILRLEERQHAERLALWSDLAPLAQQIGDRSYEQQRATWLYDLALGGKDR